MKVLVFCPTYRLEQETVDAIFRLRAIGPLDIMFTRDNPTGDGILDVLHNYRKGRSAFLAGDYDAMLTIESDMIPPADALERLAALDVEVAMGLYMFRHDRPQLNARKLEKRNRIGWPLHLFPDELESAWDTGTVEVSGAGLGCTLIQRHVLQAVAFRHAPYGHCDWHFATDCLATGIKQVVDFGTLCGHKRPDGAILWPDRHEGYIVTQGEPSPYHMLEAKTYGLH